MIFSDSRIALQAVVLISILWNASAYLQGDFGKTFCWVTEVGTNIREFSECPPNINMTWSLPDQGLRVTADEEFTVDFRIFVGSQMLFIHSPEIDHANLHACRQVLGSCTPFIEESPGLVTQAPQLTGSLDDGYASFKQDFSLPAGEHTLIAHSRFYTNGSRIHTVAEELSVDGNDTITQFPKVVTLKWDVAIGVDIEANVKLGYFSTAAEITVAVIAGIVFLYLAALSFLAVSMRNERLMKHNKLYLTLLNFSGAAIFVSTIFFWNLYMTDLTCLLTVWSTILGFSFMFIPLLTKSAIFFFTDPHRLSVDKQNHSSQEWQKSRIEILIASSCICIELTVLILWMALAFPEASPPPRDGGYRSSCKSTTTTASLLAFAFSINMLFILVAIGFIWISKREGVERASLSRARRAITGCFISIIVVVISWTAYSNNEEFSFLIRSLGIIAASIESTLWFYHAWNERSLLSRMEKIRKKHRADEPLLNKDIPEGNKARLNLEQSKKISSMKIFEELFASGVIRGYLFHHCIESLDTESVEFCSEVYSFKENADPSDLHSLALEAQSIMNEFIHPDSPKCVNISHKLRRRASKMFEKLQNEISQWDECELKEKQGSKGENITSLLRMMLERNPSDDNHAVEGATRKNSATSQTSASGSKTTVSSVDSRSSIEQSLQRLLADVHSNEEDRKSVSGGEADSRGTRTEKPKPRMSKAVLYQELLQLFDRPFREVRKLVYLNNWRSFRSSDLGIAAATWFEWMEFMEEFSAEEQGWAAYDINRRILDLETQNGSKLKQKNLRKPDAVRELQLPELRDQQKKSLRRAKSRIQLSMGQNRLHELIGIKQDSKSILSGTPKLRRTPSVASQFAKAIIGNGNTSKKLESRNSEIVGASDCPSHKVGPTSPCGSPSPRF